MKSKLVSTLFIMTFLMITPMFVQLSVGSSDFAEVELYIIQLPDADAHWVSDTSDAVKGAIKAVNVTGNNYELTNIPLVHPKVGESPPFYSMNYEIVSDWNTYKTVVESAVGAIVVNTHGEVVPVPASYSKEDWTDKIAEAMLERRMIWVNIAGYPFYYVWQEGQTNPDPETWYGDGFQHLMSHINKPDVVIPLLSGEEKDDLTFAAARNLNPITHCGWKDIDQAERITRDRPVYASDFEGYVALELWSSGLYCTGAVIGFVKPGEMFDPEACSGFGAFVHIGTRTTLTSGDVETNADTWRAYVGTAAAIWSRVSGFEGKGESTQYDDYAYGYIDYLIHATPVVISYHWYSSPEEHWEIQLGFFVMGTLKRPIYCGIDVDAIVVEIDSSAIGNSEIELDTSLSRHGTGDYGELAAQGMCLIKTGLYAFSFVDPTHISKVISGVMLFADWITSFTPSRDISSEQKIDVEYNPELQSRTGDGYEYLEFQTLIVARLTVPKAGAEYEGFDPREPWRILPIKYHFELIPDWTGGGRQYAPKAAGRMSMATYFEPENSDEYRITVYNQDFQKGIDDWYSWDEDSDSGIDCWDLLPYENSYYPREVWCAGSNLEENWPEYDKNMKAHLQKGNFWLRAYKQLELYYCFSAYIKSGDYFKIFYYDGSGKHLGASYTNCPSGGGAIINEWGSFPITETTQGITFTFISNEDDNVDNGVYLRCAEIRGKVPNDGRSDQDAGESFTGALDDGPGWKDGYLEDEDWYSFQVAAHHTITGYFHETPQDTHFLLEIWDSNGRSAGPSEEVTFYVMAGSEGTYALRVYSEIGFGQYKLTVSLEENNLPEARDLTLEPAEPLTGDELQGGYTYYDDDGDQESGTQVHWYKNHAHQPYYDNWMTIPSSATAKGETWYFIVTPNDGNEFGEPAQSTSVIVGNTPPQALNPTVSPPSPFTTDSLIAVYGFDDADGDEESDSEIWWFKNGNRQYGLDNMDTVDSSYTSKGEGWCFTVKPNDGTDFGTPQTSSPVVIQNSPPQATGPQITPSSPTSADDLTATYFFDDADGDTESGTEIRWFKDGNHQPEYDNQDTLPSTATSGGDTWHFRVTPNDGEEFGETATSPDVTIDPVNDVAVVNISLSKIFVGQAFPLEINVTAQNQGDVSETFDVEAYVLLSLIPYPVGSQQVTLDSGESEVVTIIWDTAGYEYGNYTIIGLADYVIGETDTDDNILIDGTVLVTIPGDVDGDQDVDIFDITTIANAYGTSEGEPGYNPNCDIDGDGDVDIFDVTIAANNYGQSW